jgi:hypothetical protein
MRGGGKAKAPDKVTARREAGAPAERWREITGQHNNQLNKWGAIAQQKVEAPAEGFVKAERASDKRQWHDKSGTTTTTTIL